MRLEIFKDRKLAFRQRVSRSADHKGKIRGGSEMCLDCPRHVLTRLDRARNQKILAVTQAEPGVQRGVDSVGFVGAIDSGIFIARWLERLARIDHSFSRNSEKIDDFSTGIFGYRQDTVCRSTAPAHEIEIERFVVVREMREAQRNEVVQRVDIVS